VSTTGDIVDITILGAGPTGLAAAYYAGHRDGTVRIVESLEQLGGQVAATYPEKHVYDVAGHPKILGQALVDLCVEQGLQYGAEVILGEEAKTLEHVTENGEEVLALTTENGYHNGGDIAFGTDGKLYLTIGEVHETNRAQDPTDLGGKVVRLNPDGSVPSDNPFGAGNPVYSIGHRNSFGLCVDPATGDLWETENGPSSDDEVNRIVAGANYGWPDQLGPGGGPGLTDPVLDFPQEIVPTGCAVWNGALYFGSYAYGQLHRLPLPATPARDQVVREFPEGITDVETGPDGGLYVSTVSTIYRLAGNGTAIPTISTSQGPPPVAGPSDPAGARAPLLAIVAAIALVIGLAMRVAAGRRLRRESGDP